MYNYDNEYEQGYETDYEFNPEYESDYEMEAPENEADNEYGMNPEFEMEESFETGNEYEMEDESWDNEVRVHDHRRNANRGSSYRPRPSRPAVRPGRPAYYRGAGGAYRRRQALPGRANRSFFRPGYRSAYYRRRPAGYWRMRPWHRRYAPSYTSYGYNYSGPQQYTQSNNFDALPPQQSPGGVPDHILQSIQTLTQQLAATNANVEALQQSMNNPAPANAPVGDGNAAPNTNMPTGAPAQGGEMEMEDYEYDNEYEMEGEYGDSEMEEMEMEMAEELLSTNNEMELDNFLGSFLSDKLKGLVKAVVKKTLPVAGTAAGAFLGGPLGAQVGNKIATAATKVFEMDISGLSNEDQEFEVAKAIVRLATDAAREMEEGESSGDPGQDAKNALIQSALQNARGLLIKKGGYNNGPGGY